MGLYWLFMIPGLLLGIWAQIKLSHAYSKYSKVPVESGMTGAQAARRILDNAGLRDMPVEEVPGHLSDHYDPTKRALFLSSENFSGRTVAAVGVAAHESGHALQHQAAYGIVRCPHGIGAGDAVCEHGLHGNFLLGMFMNFLSIALWIIIATFSVITLFQLVTLPVEYDASRRAKEQLFRLGLVREDERAGISKVLDAAALTYVAALVSSILNLLYYITLARDSRR